MVIDLCVQPAAECHSYADFMDLCAGDKYLLAIEDSASARPAVSHLERSWLAQWPMRQWLAFYHKLGFLLLCQ